MTGHFELEPFYEGKNLQIYLFKYGEIGFPTIPELSEAEIREPRLGKKRVKRLGYRRWSWGSSYAPTHQILWGDGDLEYYNLPGASPPADVEYRSVGYEPSWVLMTSPYTCRVRFVPKIFDLELGAWIVERSRVYLTVSLPHLFSFANITPEDLVTLEDYSGELAFRCQDGKIDCQFLSEQVPTSFWLRKNQPPSFPEMTESLAKLCDTRLPLNLKIDDLTKYCYFSVEGSYWRLPSNRSLSSTEAVALFGINQSMEIRFLSEKPNTGTILPLEEVESIGESDTLRCYLHKGDLFIILPSFNRREDEEHCGYEELNLTRGYYHFTKYKVVLTSTSNSEKDLERYGIRKLKFNESAEGKRVRVAQIEKGKLKYLHGYYAFESDIRKRSSKQTLADYQALSIRHTPPPPLTEWWVEDLEEYDRLVESQEFLPQMSVRVGNEILAVPSDSRYCSAKVFQEQVRFITKNEERDAYLWRVLDWEEFLQRAKSVFPATAEALTKAVFDGAVVGLISASQATTWLTGKVR